MENQIESNIYSNYFPAKKLQKIYFLIGLGIFIIFVAINIIYIENNNKTSFELYLKSKKFLYIKEYSSAEKLIKFLKDHNFSKIYLFVGSMKTQFPKIKSDNNQLYNHGDMDIFKFKNILEENKIELVPFITLNDEEDYDNFQFFGAIPEVCDIMSKLDFSTILLDLEPTQKTNFEVLLKTYENCGRYIKVSAILLSNWLNIKMSDLKNDISSGFYRRFQNYETFIDAILSITDYSVLKVNSSQYNTVNSILQEFDIIRKRHKSNKVTTILGIDPNHNETDLILRSNKDKDKFFDFFVKVTKKFSEVTINNYQWWYKDLYCEDPDTNITYYFGPPKDC